MTASSPSCGRNWNRCSCLSVDSRNLRGGSKLTPEIEQAIEQARQVIVVLSPNTINWPGCAGNQESDSG